jgi:hypothetical protein
VSGVRHADVCWGQPDIFAFVEADNETALAGLVLTQVHGIPGIETTDTRIVAPV